MTNRTGRRPGRAKPLAEFVDDCLGPALARQGFSGADIVGSWAEIVGERLAAASQPIRVEWPRRRPGIESGRTDPATLVVRVEGAFALELQHLAPVVTERVNAFYGWRCVGRIVLKQGPIPQRPLPAAPPRPLAPADARRLEAALVPIDEAPLRDALGRLGRAVLASADGPAGPAVPQSSPH